MAFSCVRLSIPVIGLLVCSVGTAAAAYDTAIGPLSFELRTSDGAPVAGVSIEYDASAERLIFGQLTFKRTIAHGSIVTSPDGNAAVPSIVAASRSTRTRFVGFEARVGGVKEPFEYEGHYLECETLAVTYDSENQPRPYGPDCGGVRLSYSGEEARTGVSLPAQSIACRYGETAAQLKLHQIQDVTGCRLAAARVPLGSLKDGLVLSPLPVSQPRAQ